MPALIAVCVLTSKRLILLAESICFILDFFCQDLPLETRCFNSKRTRQESQDNKQLNKQGKYNNNIETLCTSVVAHSLCSKCAEGKALLTQFACCNPAEAIKVDSPGSRPSSKPRETIQRTCTGHCNHCGCSYCRETLQQPSADCKHHADSDMVLPFKPCQELQLNFSRL